MSGDVRTNALKGMKELAAASGIEIKRWPDEDADAVRWMAEDRAELKLCLEIGVRDGGWMYMLSALLAPPVEYIALDIAWGKHWGKMCPVLNTRGITVREVLGSSRSPTTMEKVKAVLHGRQLDLLHVDGSHDVADAYSDLVTFAPLVRAGGYIWMHDVHPQRGPHDALAKACRGDAQRRVQWIRQSWFMHWEDPGKYCGNAVLKMGA